MPNEVCMFVVKMKLLMSMFLCCSFLSITVHSHFSVAFYDVIGSMAFNGSTLTNSSTGCVLSSFRDGVLECDPDSKLSDGNFGPMDSVNDDLGSFFVLSRQSEQTGAIQYTLNDTTQSVSIVLHFFNYPKASIGLPLISVTTTKKDPISFTFADNSDLDQADSTIRRTILNLHLMAPINFISLNIEFGNNSKIDWLFVSEVGITTGVQTSDLTPVVFQDGALSESSLGPDDPHSIISISCTVAISGSFNWIWEYEGGNIPASNRHKIWIADATRTSILTISSLRYSDAGNYSCTVNHVSGSILYTKVVKVSLNTGVEAYFNDPNSTGGNVVITCEAYGYLGGTTIEFKRNNQLITPVQMKYSLTFKEGEKDSINAIGAVGGSQIAELEIANVEPLDYGAYVCHYLDQSAQIVLHTQYRYSTMTVVKSLHSTMTAVKSLSASALTTSISEPSSSSSNNILPILLGISFGVVIMLVAFLVILIVVIIRKKNRKQSWSKNTKCPDANHLPSSLNEHQREVTYSMIEDRALGLHFNNTMHGSSYLNLTMENGDAALPLHKHASDVDITKSNNSTQASPFQSMETLYSEITMGSSDEKLNRNCFYSNSSLNYQNISKYDHIQPLSFVFSGTYSNGGPIYDVPKSSSVKPIPKISQSNLEELSKIGDGQFGEVVLARTCGLSLKDLGLSDIDEGEETIIDVAVKKMKLQDSDKSLQMAFEKEMKFMSQLQHENVVRLLAVSVDKSQPFMVMEYMENGDLNQFLLRHNFTKDHPPTSQDELSPQNLLSMAIQIARGMAYLASHNYIHRDVATRNCLVGENNIVKIADFGLSRSLYDSAYYRVKGKAKVPIRSMATECFYGKFSQFSDVWAYGVTVWEIYTMAREPPYSTYSDVEMIEDALKGEHRQLLSKPFACPKEIYDIIRSSCWVMEYEDRATFLSVHEQLVEMCHKLYSENNSYFAHE